MTVQRFLTKVRVTQTEGQINELFEELKEGDTGGLPWGLQRVEGVRAGGRSGTVT